MNDTDTPKQKLSQSADKIEIDITGEFMQVINAEFESLRKQIRDLERRIARYDSIYETIFREEAERRIGLGKQINSGAMAEYSPSRLEQFLRNARRGL